MWRGHVTRSHDEHTSESVVGHVDAHHGQLHPGSDEAWPDVLARRVPTHPWVTTIYYLVGAGTEGDNISDTGGGGLHKTVRYRVPRSVSWQDYIAMAHYIVMAMLNCHSNFTFHYHGKITLSWQRCIVMAILHYHCNITLSWHHYSKSTIVFQTKAKVPFHGKQG